MPYSCWESPRLPSSPFAFDSVCCFQRYKGEAFSRALEVHLADLLDTLANKLKAQITQFQNITTKHLKQICFQSNLSFSHLYLFFHAWPAAGGANGLFRLISGSFGLGPSASA
jgi:hypothetical protein